MLQPGCSSNPAITCAQPIPLLVFRLCARIHGDQENSYLAVSDSKALCARARIANEADGALRRHYTELLQLTQ